jgi:hypothetical protein
MALARLRLEELYLISLEERSDLLLEAARDAWSQNDHHGVSFTTFSHRVFSGLCAQPPLFLGSPGLAPSTMESRFMQEREELEAIVHYIAAAPTFLTSLERLSSEQQRTGF